MPEHDTRQVPTLGTTLPMSYPDAVSAVRDALGAQGFGILTEIDLQATMKAKLDKDIAPQVILGACRPPLAYVAIQADPSVAVLLPCNVVVRAVDSTTSEVEAFDPMAMLQFSAAEAIVDVAADARQRLAAALEQLTRPTMAATPESRMES